MTKYDYKIVSMPAQALSAREIEEGADPVAATLEHEFNELGLKGWDFAGTQRVEMRTGGFLRRRTVSRDVFVFRRPVPKLAEQAPHLPTTAEKVRARRVSHPKLVADAKERRRIKIDKSEAKATPELPAIAAE